MNEVAFVQKRERDWQRLTKLCDQAELSLKRLRAEEFHEFVGLYRRVSADLATVRTYSNNLQLITFLNDVVTRTYGILYRSPKRAIGSVVKESIALAAQTARRCKYFVLASLVISLLGFFITFQTMSRLPQTRSVFVPSAYKKVFDQWKSGEFEERNFEDSALMTGFYMSNNPKVALVATGLSASTFGLGTAGILYQNGQLLGALTYEMSTVGKAPYLFASISPHGVTEMSGMVISGSAGFVLGWALINPGRRKRGEALKAAGKDAIVLLVTSWIMMFMAAPIEGFFSFNPSVPMVAKVGFAVCSAIAWAIFWTSFGKVKQESPASA